MNLITGESTFQPIFNVMSRVLKFIWAENESMKTQEIRLFKVSRHVKHL